MWSVRLALLLQAVARELAELALVRPFASNQEIQDIDSAFSLWNAVSPCGDKALAEVDIFLVYSRRLDENPVASIAAANVQNSFRARSEPWHRCFRDFHVEAANLTAAEDIYDSRGYAVRKDWVNGPNKVFRFILQSFLEKSFVSDYEAFFFMEFDSTPLRPFWLDQFYAEVFHYPRTAIRGSRYRGDSWDNFLHHIPNSLLYHMNGNAIYFLRHPWLSFLAQKLEEDATSENGSVAFDVRMAQLTLEAPTRSDLQTAWTQNVPEGENPYQDDSLLVGNYANTLLNDSFEPPEFVRHGALANIFENLDESLVTLAVQAFHQANATLLMESLRESAFREVVVVSSVDFAPTPGTAPSLRVVPATLPEHMALCDLAAAVHTTFFLFTDTYHFIPGPTHVLVNGSRPVLPYIPASSVFCTAYPECTTSLDQAENFYGVKLNYHHNKYETLFHTLLAREFCQSWNLAAAAMGSFHSCDYQHGPTADDYIAWLISMDKAFDYMPKNKERVGWRQWSVLWNAHPADQRACSIYTESDALKRKQSIKECSLYIQDGDACNADENCTFRAIFEAGKCMSTSEFRLLPAMMDARTSTWTISTSSTTTSRTSTLSSSTRSRTLTSSWTTLTATSSTSTTRSTVSGTFSTVFASSTRTQSAQPTISLPTFCKEDGLPIVGVDVSNCIGRVAGESCSVICTGSFEGDPATFVCGNDGTFTGEIHCQESTCAVETLPDGFETDCEQTPPGGSCFVRCPEGYQPAQAMYICTTNAEFLGVPPTCELQLCGLVGLPETAGVDTLACVEGVRSGQSCEVGCSYGFEGDSSTYRCVQGVFEGSPPACQRKACEAPREEVSFSSSCGAELLHGQSCLSSCKPGFMGAATQLQCENGILTGLPPVCIGSLCSLEGIVIGTGLDTSDCLGKRTSESCTLKCQRGYTPVGQPNLTCQSNGRFHSEEFRCLPKPCGDLSAVPSFASSAVGNSCSGLAFGQVCAAFCEIGWQIQGNASVIVCDDSGDASQGFAQYFSENRSYLPAERTQPMFRCIALECTEGLPSMKGVSHDCEGKTTHETCQVNAQLGYFADRPSTLTCQADGGFQGDWPVILPQTCPNFSFSPGVGSTCRNATLGTECWAYCESGWIGSPRRYECKLNATGQLQLEALEGITCTISGNRNGRRLAQSCADANADVRLLNPSFLHSCASLQDGDVCVVHCSSGFAMLEAEPALLSCQDGQFVGGLLPSCSPRSCDFAFPTGTGVQHDCNGRKTGENCTAQCGEEFTYTFGGAETFTCTSSGNFLGTNPSCERKFCEDLQIPELYTHNCREKRSGDTCGVTCALGYYFASWGSQFLCNGTFQGTLPSCQPNPCTDVPALGEVFSGSCEGLTTGESCELSCGAGFSPNSSWLTCDESGAFLGAYPLCNPANCPGSFALDHNESIAHNCETVPFGRSCNVYCAPGYDLLDQTASLWSCQLNGSQQMLEGVLPLCEPARCWLGLPVSLQSYTNNCSGLAFKESCTLQCAMGYTAHGVHGDHGVHRPGSIGSDGGSSISSTYHCSSNGVAQTDNTRPNCTLRTCVSNLTLPGVLTTCEDVQLNGTCFAFCAPGYGLKGNAQRWHCDASDLPAIDAAAVIDGIGLRGFLPVCLPETCSYKIPWSFRFSHNCHNVTTWSSCEVECADPFVGGQTSLQCQPNGALAGQLPECNEVTFTGTSTSTSAFTQTATTTFIFLISTNLTLLVSDADALIAHPGSKGGFASALAQIFQLQPEEAERIDVELQVDSENLLVIAEVQSTDELRSLLDRLTLDEVNIIVNNYVTTAIDNFSQETLTVLSMEIEVLDGNQIRVWGLQEAADNPVMASTLWVPILAASCVLLVCCCSCAIRHQCRKSPAETRQAVHSEDQRQNDRHSPAKDFGSELEKPPSMADAGLVDAGIYLEEEGLDQDNEEVRLRLEDVGVFYEEGDFSESLSMQPEAGAESQAPQQESSASASVLPSQPGPGLSVLRHAKDFGSELEKPPSMADAGLVDAGIYLEEEGMDNDKAVSDAASEESDEDGLHL